MPEVLVKLVQINNKILFQARRCWMRWHQSHWYVIAAQSIGIKITLNSHTKKHNSMVRCANERNTRPNEGTLTIVVHCQLEGVDYV